MTTNYEKNLYENYNALFFSASEQNDPLQYYHLFAKYAAKYQQRWAFIKLLKEHMSIDDDRYRLWVQVWKQNYKHISKAIRLVKHYRKSKNLEAIGIESTYAVGDMQRYREWLRIIANEMMELRMKAKEARKEIREAA